MSLLEFINPQIVVAALVSRLRTLAPPDATLDKIAAGGELQRTDWEHVRALVREYRPILDLTPWQFSGLKHWPELERQRQILEPVGQCVGSLHVGSQGSCVGSGFLVGPALVMTTHSAAALFSTGVGQRDIQFIPAMEPRVRFAQEKGFHEVPVQRVELIHPFLDLALIRLDASRPLPRHACLSTTAPAVGAKHRVAVIGYVEFPARLAGDKELFPDDGREHLSPGELGEPAIIERHGNRMWGLSHDCTTTPGSVGGPLIDLETGDVLGMHVKGRYLMSGIAISMNEILRDARVVSVLGGDPSTASRLAWNEYWLRYEPEQSAAESDGKAVAVAAFDIRAALGRAQNAFSKPDDFASFLTNNGYTEVVAAVPRPTSDDPLYLEALIRALGRRGQLDSRFFDALSEVDGVKSLSSPQDDAPQSKSMFGRRRPVSSQRRWQMGRARAEEVPHAAAEFTASIGYFTAGSQACRSVVRLDMEGNEGRVSCTAWLITKSLVMAPAHVVAVAIGTSGATRRAHAVSGQVVCDFDSAATGASRAIEGCELIAPSVDVAFLRLKEPLADREPLRISTTPLKRHTAIGVIHHPMGGPKQVSIGRLEDCDEQTLRYSVASSSGSSGAPIFDLEWQVAGMHLTSSQQGEASGVSFGAILNLLRVEGFESKLWREIVSSQPRLKTVDRALYTRFEQPPKGGSSPEVSIIIEVLDSLATLADVPDLKIRSRNGNFVTALITSSGALHALVERPDVLAVQANHQMSVQECAQSVPHVGATKIHTNEAEDGALALIAVVDDGVDIFHKCMLNDKGRTRILAFWDQKDGGTQQTVAFSQAGQKLVESLDLKGGVLYVMRDIQRLLRGTSKVPATFPQSELMEHGTGVCSIAAGRRTGNSEQHFPGGVAPGAYLIVVRYDLKSQSVGSAQSHIDALAFIEGLATGLNRPVVVNISNGMNIGAHDGSSPVERVCRDFLKSGDARGRAIVKSAGNEAGSGRHAMISPAVGSEMELRWRTQPGKSQIGRIVAETVDIWFDSRNTYSFRLKPPTGVWSEDIVSFPVKGMLPNGNHIDAVCEPNFAYNTDANICIRIEPSERGEVEAGDWTLRIKAEQVMEKKPIHAWIEAVQNRDIRFQDNPKDEVTITIPGTAKDVISVGAVEIAEYMRLYEFSSRGPTREGKEKPELVAPGVGLRAALAASVDEADSTVTRRKGTSYAAPHVAGAIALVFSAREKRKLSRLTTHQLRSALIRSLRHYNVMWDENTGFGELDADAFFKLAMKIP